MYWGHSETEQNKRICKLLGVARGQMQLLRENEKFAAKYKLAMAERNLEAAAIPIARREERLEALQVLFNQLPPEQIKYKLLCLKLAKAEDQAIGTNLHLHAHVDVPPKAESYEQWKAQMQEMKT